METADKSDSLNVSKHLNSLEGAQWGKPGPGGSYWRQSALTGQGFHEKMVRNPCVLFLMSCVLFLISPHQGWSSSADPRKRQFEVKKGENEALKREMADIEQKRLEEHRSLTSEVGLELAPLMKAQPTGKPRKDEVTGYMMDARLTSTDITKHAAQQTVQPWHKKVSELTVSH